MRAGHADARCWRARPSGVGSRCSVMAVRCKGRLMSNAQAGSVSLKGVLCSAADKRYLSSVAGELFPPIGARDDDYGNGLTIFIGVSGIISPPYIAKA